MKQMIHPVVLLAQEVEEAAHQGLEVEVLVHLAEPVVAHQDQQRAVHLVEAEDHLEVQSKAVHLVEAEAHLAVQSKAAHPVEVEAHLVVQSKEVHLVEAEAHLVVRRKGALQERVRRADCYSLTNQIVIL